MGGLAVCDGHQGLGLGAALLANALQRAFSADVADYGLVEHAKRAQAAKFYAHHGLISIPDAARTLFLPLASVGALVKEVVS